MANLTGKQRAQYVQEMFARIAPGYDRMNRIMTAGQDIGWRREVIRRAALPPGGRLLDLGAGTGDLSYEALRQYPGIRPVAADFTIEMMRTGRQRPASENLDWTGADTLHLPFQDKTFDAVISGFLLRNVAQLPLALEEQVRVLKPGGRWVALDTTRPRKNLLSPFINLHLHAIIPTLGRFLARQAEAYRYLPESTDHFLAAELLAAQMVEAGLREVSFRILMFGTVAIHWGVR